MIKYLSLFSGIGGFDLGFDRAGMECAGQVEIDDKARGVLERHWPGVKRINDVREVKGDEFGAVDVICGGFPCQDVSLAGRRAGLAGERSGLWYEFHRIIESAKPRWAIIENVPGLLSSHSGRDFATILHALVKCGYGVTWRVLDAQYFGVPQRRRRVFIVGSLGDGSSAEILFEREGGSGNTAKGRSARAELARDVAASLKGSSGERGFPLDFEAGLAVTPYVAATLNSGGNDGGFRTEPGEHLVAALTPWDCESKRIHRTNGAAPTLAGSDGGGGQRFPNFATQTGVRRLTPVECERLQGFPDNHTGGQSDSTRYRQLGNAVAVPVAHWLGLNIAKASRDGDKRDE